MPKNQGKRQQSMSEFAVRGTPGAVARPRQDGGEAGNAAAAREEGRTEEPSIKQVLMAVQESLAAVVVAVDSLTARFDSERSRVTAIEVQVREAEDRIGALDDEVVPLKRRVDETERRLSELQKQLQEQEARGRRNNVRILGLPETNNGGTMEQYIESVIKASLPDAQLSPFFTVERAHRALMVRPPPGAPPRAVIARILNYRDRDAVLRAARRLGEVRFEGGKLSYFPDFTLEVQKQRKTFWDIKQQLRRRKIVYAMLYPAKLKIMHAGRAHFFTEPEAAREYMERHLLHVGEGASPTETPRRNPRQSLRVQADVHHGQQNGVSDSQILEAEGLLDTND